jgi:RNA polymerase sigma-70 factor (ECF subfamily)
VDSSPSETGDLAPPVPVEQEFKATSDSRFSVEVLPEPIIQELWTKAEADRYGLSADDFASVLSAVGAKVNHGLPAGVSARVKQKVDFFRSLHLPELALAHACALGREAAWEQFLRLYRVPLARAAIGITGSASLGEELADALYAELYGLREREGERRSPLESYSGRGSLLSWLRTTLVQRYRDHYRRTHRETPIDEFDCPAPACVTPPKNELAVLTSGVAQIIRELGAEDRFLLAAYFLDRQTLLEIARTLDVHEATISRRIKRLTLELRNRLLEQLRRRGLRKAAAEEALGIDPRDVEINLRALLQTSRSNPFLEQRDGTQKQEPEAR